MKRYITTTLHDYIKESINIHTILYKLKKRFIKEISVDYDYELNNGYCEDIAYAFIEAIGGETDTTYIIDDGWFWSVDKISEYKTKSNEYWNIDNLKKYGKPSFGYEYLKDIDLKGHVWIYSNGKHYDIECLDGVDNFWELPIYKRQVSTDIVVYKRVDKGVVAILGGKVVGELVLNDYWTEIEYINDDSIKNNITIPDNFEFVTMVQSDIENKGIATNMFKYALDTTNKDGIALSKLFIADKSIHTIMKNIHAYSIDDWYILRK